MQIPFEARGGKQFVNDQPELGPIRRVRFAKKLRARAQRLII